MIKRILVALDPDADTPVATQYAVTLAQQHEATVTGVAVVDLHTIEAHARGGGIGSMFYGEKIRESETTEARARAQELLADFEATLEPTGVSFTSVTREGTPYELLAAALRYHDLLVIGREPHFFYSHPERETNTLARVVKAASAPTFIVGKQYEAIGRVLVAYDGSAASARTLHSFVQQRPFGTDVRVELLFVGKEEEGTALLKEAQSLFEAHGFSTQTTVQRGGDPARQIVEYAQQSQADVVVAGAHSVSKLKALAFGSTTDALIAQCPAPLYLHH